MSLTIQSRRKLSFREITSNPHDVQRTFATAKSYRNPFHICPKIPTSNIPIPARWEHNQRGLRARPRQYSHGGGRENAKLFFVCYFKKAWQLLCKSKRGWSFKANRQVLPAASTLHTVSRRDAIRFPWASTSAKLEIGKMFNIFLKFNLDMTKPKTRLLAFVSAPWHSLQVATRTTGFKLQTPLPFPLPSQFYRKRDREGGKFSTIDHPIAHPAQVSERFFICFAFSVNTLSRSQNATKDLPNLPKTSGQEFFRKPYPGGGDGCSVPGWNKNIHRRGFVSIRTSTASRFVPAEWVPWKHTHTRAHNHFGMFLLLRFKCNLKHILPSFLADLFRYFFACFYSNFCLPFLASMVIPGRNTKPFWRRILSGHPAPSTLGAPKTFLTSTSFRCKLSHLSDVPYPSRDCVLSHSHIVMGNKRKKGTGPPQTR